MKGLRIIALGFLAFIAVAGCDDGYLRGSVSPSEDGGTYLAVADDSGSTCGPLLLDGKPWPYKTDEPGPVSPGRHRIECGGWIEFDIPEGTIFKFDDWGPRSGS